MTSYFENQSEVNKEKYWVKMSKLDWEQETQISNKLLMLIKSGAAT